MVTSESSATRLALLLCAAALTASMPVKPGSDQSGVTLEGEWRGTGADGCPVYMAATTVDLVAVAGCNAGLYAAAYSMSSGVARLNYAFSPNSTLTTLSFSVTRNATSLVLSGSITPNPLVLSAETQGSLEGSWVGTGQGPNPPASFLQTSFRGHIFTSMVAPDLTSLHNVSLTLGTADIATIPTSKAVIDYAIPEDHTQIPARITDVSVESDGSGYEIKHGASFPFDSHLLRHTDPLPLEGVWVGYNAPGCTYTLAVNGYEFRSYVTACSSADAMDNIGVYGLMQALTYPVTYRMGYAYTNVPGLAGTAADMTANVQGDILTVKMVATGQEFTYHRA